MIRTTNDIESMLAELVLLQEKLYATRMLCGQVVLKAQRDTAPHESLSRIFTSLGVHASTVDGMIKQLQKETK